MTSKLAGLGMARQEPTPLVEPVVLGSSEEGHAFTLTPVNVNDEVYKEICIDFENANMTVVGIERLTNQHLWKRFDHERNLMIEQRTSLEPDYKLNEKYLYHGTSALKSLICEEGLDHRMSKEGCFGKGIYFSDYPRKCIKYAERGENSVSFILLARVILGTPKVFKKGEKCKSLVREPEKTPPYTGYRFYDSVQGCPVNHKEYVVYESRRALVECLIAFTRKENINPLPVDQKSAVVNNRADFSDSDFSDSDSDMRPRPNNFEDQETASSDDDEDNNAETGDSDRKKIKSDSAEILLNKKRDEFQRKTQVKDEYIVDHYLLQGNMSVSQAIKLYNERPSDDPLQDEDESEPRERSKLELDLEEAAKRPEHPTAGSPEWVALSKDDKEAVIKNLVEDFLSVTGLTDKDDADYARRCLEIVNYNLDLAVIAHYEEM